MEQRASATRPIIRLRDNCILIDTDTARRAKKRLIRTVKPAQALAATLTGVVEVAAQDTKVIVGGSLLTVREQLKSGPTRDPMASPAALQAPLTDSQTHALPLQTRPTSFGLGGCMIHPRARAPTTP